MKVKIAPSILAADFARLAEAAAIAERGGAELLHVDSMDGHFVPNLTLGPPIVRALRKATSLPLDCHLMIEHPQRWIDEFLDAGANLISVHLEADRHLHRALDQIRAGGAKAGIALNPATPAGAIADAVQYCDFVLVMSVNPGFGGQKFIAPVVPKIRKVAEMIRERGLKIPIEVDGGIDAKTAPEVVRAGAEILVAGSAVYGAADPVTAIQNIREAATATVA